MQIKEHDLTKGKLPLVVLRYSMPFLLMNIVQTLLVLTDLFFIGHFTEGAAQVSAVTISASVLLTHLFIIFGISAAITILIGRFFGAKELDKMDSIVGTAMSLFLIIGAVITVELYFAMPYLLKLLAIPKVAEGYAITYSRIFAFAFIPSCGLLLISSVLRGVGNSATPFMFVCVGVAINFVLDIVFIVYFRQGSAGAAVATVISQVVACFFVVWYVRKKEFLFRFEIKDFRFDKQAAKDILYLGLPLSFQDTFVEISFLVLVYLANTLGLAASAAYGILSRAWSLTLLPAYSFALALSAVVAQNLGAIKIKRAKQAMNWCIVYSAIPCWLFAVMLLIKPKWLMQTFTLDTDVIQEGVSALKTITWELFLVPFSFCLSSFFNACGKTLFTMTVNCVGAFCVRTLLAFIFVMVMGGGLFEMGYSFIISEVFVFVAFVIYMKSNRWINNPVMKKANKSHRKIGRLLRSTT